MKTMLCILIIVQLVLPVAMLLQSKSPTVRISTQSSSFTTNERCHWNCQFHSRIKHALKLRASPLDYINPLMDLNEVANSFTPVATASSALTTSSPKEMLDVADVSTLNSLPSMVTGASSLNLLGNDLIIFLCSTIGIVPLFRWLNASPVLGFLAAGLLMGPAGLQLFSDLTDMEALADFGVLFLLFEQGLELTVERLRSLSKFAFGMGTAQVLLCTGAFFIFPFLGGVQFLEYFVRADEAVVDITRLDEAVVIGAALSLSSSAFVLKILQEKNQLSSKFGSASLGVLLMQDIAVVPLLVLLPIMEGNAGGAMPLSAQAALLGATFAKAFVGLGGILVVGGAIVRYLFSIVARSRSSETFVALCLLVAVGIGGITDALGLSSTLGAFVAGTLLAESNYRTQIETDIKPFKGLLLGLFFLTTGASVDPYVIQQQWPTVLALLTGLITFKSVIISGLGPVFGLSKAESIRTGLLLSGGGEFAFVVLTLADKLNVLPDQLAKMLVGVVVLSMALTPYLSNLGDKLAILIQENENKQTYANAVKSGTAISASKMRANDKMDDGAPATENSSSSRPDGATVSALSNNDNVQANSEADTIVICGYGMVGETVIKFLTSPTVQQVMDKPINTNSRDSPHDESEEDRLRYLAFDLDPTLVMQGYKDGYRILYGDGSQPLVLATAGVTAPRAFVITYAEPEESFKAVERIHQAFPGVPIIARASCTDDYDNLLEAGATSVVCDEREASFRLAGSVLSDVGVSINTIENLNEEMSEYLEARDLQLYQQRNGLGAGLATGATAEVSASPQQNKQQRQRRQVLTSSKSNINNADILSGGGTGFSSSSYFKTAKENLANIMESVISLGEDYAWVSDDEIKENLAQKAQLDELQQNIFSTTMEGDSTGIGSTGSSSSSSSITELNFDDEYDEPSGSSSTSRGNSRDGGGGEEEAQQTPAVVSTASREDQQISAAGIPASSEDQVVLLNGAPPPPPPQPATSSSSSSSSSTSSPGTRSSSSAAAEEELGVKICVLPSPPQSGAKDDKEGTSSNGGNNNDSNSNNGENDDSEGSSIEIL